LKIKTTRAAVLAESKKPLVVDEIELPGELCCGQVLVEIRYSGICGAQINEIDAVKGPDKFLPHLLGHEAVGRVLEAGPGVTTVKDGDQVILHWRPSAGIQSATPAYRWQGRHLNAGWVTTFNRHAVISENRLTLLPEGLEPRVAPLFGCAVTTAMGVVNNDAQIKIGQSVVIFGLGGVGLNLVQAAGMVSAHPIAGLDLWDSKIDLAKRFGLTHGFNSRGLGRAEVDDWVKGVVGPGGADVVIDTTGNSRVIEQAYELTHKDGKTILVGVPTKGDNISIYSLPLHFNKILKGSEGGRCLPHIDIPRYARLVRAGKMKLDGLITHEFSLDQINQALDLVRRGEAGRVLIDLNR